MLAAIAVPKYHRPERQRPTRPPSRGMAGALSSAAAINYAARKANSTKGVGRRQLRRRRHGLLTYGAGACTTALPTHGTACTIGSVAIADGATRELHAHLAPGTRVRPPSRPSASAETLRAPCAPALGAPGDAPAAPPRSCAAARGRSGFTLIELIMVIALVGALAIFALPRIARPDAPGAWAPMPTSCAAQALAMQRLALTQRRPGGRHPHRQRRGLRLRRRRPRSLSAALPGRGVALHRRRRHAHGHLQPCQRRHGRHLERQRAADHGEPRQHVDRLRARERHRADAQRPLTPGR
ncbi:MAG: type II secretion system GspH family protein [Comamonadaceae bacterium]|nr:type II secretion system GspH family protein [Comamonadaceae bacterium]